MSCLFVSSRLLIGDVTLHCSYLGDMALRRFPQNLQNTQASAEILSDYTYTIRSGVANPRGVVVCIYGVWFCMAYSPYAVQYQMPWCFCGPPTVHRFAGHSFQKVLVFIEMDENRPSITVERRLNLPLEFDDGIYFDEMTSTLDGWKQSLDTIVLVEIQRQKQVTFKREKRVSPFKMRRLPDRRVKGGCHVFSGLG